VAVNKKLKAVIISFTGTNSSIHWDINTKAKLRPIFWQAEPLPFLTEEKITAYVGMKMHYGFQTMYEGSRIQMLQTLYDLSFKIDFKDHEILFTGFSMGGALAQIAAGDFYEVLGYGDRISLYTFGQPRIGNRLYAIYYGKLPFAERIYRIVRRGDLVPHVPPFSSYFHIKQAYQILDNGDVITCDNLYNDGTGEVAGSCSGDFPFKIIYNNHRDYYGIRRACRD
jgi:predicted lipase